MKLLYKKSFTKSYQKFNQKLRTKITSSITIFLDNPFDDRLNNHSLEGKHKGKRSINAGGDIRIIFMELSDGRYKLVELVDVGTHSKLY